MRQLSIFKADQLQHEDSIVGVFQNPYTGISACMLAPLPLFCLPSGRNDFSEYPVKVRCLAVDDSGQIIVAPELLFNGVVNDFLSNLSNCIQQVKMSCLISERNASPFLLEQAVALEFWNLHDKTTSTIIEQWGDLLKESSHLDFDSKSNFQDSFKIKILEGVDDLKECLSPEIKDLITLRPNLDLNIVARFMYKAKFYGGNAPAFALQALRTESLPMLRLISCEMGSEILETVFSGDSLPTALSERLKVHPRMIRHYVRSAKSIPDMRVAMFLSTLDVLKHLEFKYWPVSNSSWLNLIKMIEICHLTPDGHLISDGAPWVAAVAKGLKLIDEPYSNEIWQYSILNFFEYGLTLEQLSVQMYKTLYQIDGLAINENFREGSIAYRFSMGLLDSHPNNFCNEWLNSFSNIQPIEINGHRFERIKTIEECVYYGKILKNCLQNPKQILQNLFPNKMLFCISFISKPIALCTLSISNFENEIEITCQQLKGFKNAKVSNTVKNACEDFMMYLYQNKKDLKGFSLLSTAILELCA